MADFPSARAFDVPFREQAAFWRRKVNVSTNTHRDLQREDHAHGFMVAGAARVDLLDDLRRAVDKAVLAGGTMAAFRRDFDALVERTGWEYNGGRNWRTRIIYETNVRSAYMAGRWTQMQAIKHRRPFWQYVHNDSVKHPRLEHVAWNGTILLADDPWWSTHFTPNGYGCHCYVTTLAQGDLDRMGKAGPDDAPTMVEDSQGIDPGFDYNVGVASRSMPAAVRFGQKVMGLPPAWREAALGDAQLRPTDTYADWPVTIERVVGELTQAETGTAPVRPRGSTHPVGFLRPETAATLLSRPLVTSPPTTALLGVEDHRVYHALRSAKGDDAPVLRQVIGQLPTWLADADTVVLCDTREGNLVYARRLEGGRYVKMVFDLDEPAERNRIMRKTKLPAHWLRTIGLVEGHNLKQTHYVHLDGPPL